MHIVLDFDGTITAHDTIDALAQAAIALKGAGVGTEKTKESASQYEQQQQDSWQACWRAIVQAYLDDYHSHVSQYRPAAADRATLAQEAAYLQSMRGMEAMSVGRVRASGLFAGLELWQLEEGGRRATVPGGKSTMATAEAPPPAVALRSGFAPFVKDISRRGWPVSIVSVNWSDAWIRGVVKSGCQFTEDEKEDAMLGVRIFSNTTTAAGDIVSNFERRGGCSDGVDDNHSKNSPITSSGDKKEALEVAVADAAATESDLVYIGDSTTDLECLLAAATTSDGGGIAVAGDGPERSSLVQTLVRIGYRVPHVSQIGNVCGWDTGATVGTPQGPKQRLRLAWARDFNEIMASEFF